MSDSVRNRITRALDEATAKARELAKAIGLRPNQPRMAPIPVPSRYPKK